MDRKHNSNNGEDDDFDSEEWSENDDIKLGDYEGDNSITIEDQPENDELPLDDDYTYEEETEKYGARNNEELADLQ